MTNKENQKYSTILLVFVLFVSTSPLLADVWLPLLFTKCHCPFSPNIQYSTVYGLFANVKNWKKKSLIYDREQCDRKTKWLSSIRISYFNFQLPSRPTNQRRAWLHFKSFHPPNCIHVCLKNKTSWCSLYCIWIEHFRYLKGSLMHSQPPGF